MLSEMLKVKRFERYVPIIGWVRSYQRAWLRDDLVSGVVVGAIMIPVAMAYAQMAGVPPQAGLYSAIVGMTAYAIFATSRHLKITTSSTMSIMSIAVVAPLAAGDPAAFMALSSALALTVGIIMLVLAIVKLGFISDFLAKSVMTGYIFGVACLIAISQLPKVFGVPGGSGTFFEQVAAIHQQAAGDQRLLAGAGHRHDRHLILLIKRFKPLIPGALVALVLGIVTVIASAIECAVRRQRRRRHPDRDAVPDDPQHQPERHSIPHRRRGRHRVSGGRRNVGDRARLCGEVSLRGECRSGAAGDGRGECELGPVSGHHDRHEPVQHGERRSGRRAHPALVPGQRRRHPGRRRLPGAAAAQSAHGGAGRHRAEFDPGAVQLRGVPALLSPAQDRFCPGAHRAGGRCVDECHDRPGDCGPVVAGDAVVSRQPAVHRDPGQTRERRIRRHGPARRTRSRFPAW